MWERLGRKKMATVVPKITAAETSQELMKLGIKPTWKQITSHLFVSDQPE